VLTFNNGSAWFWRVLAFRKDHSPQVATFAHCIGKADPINPYTCYHRLSYM